jgi:hypothetical protein
VQIPDRSPDDVRKVVFFRTPDTTVHSPPFRIVG